jgi:hypothetical protein
VREAWQEHLHHKPSSCTPFLEDHLSWDNGEQSICRRHWLNSLTISNDSEELFPGLSHLLRTSLSTMRAEVEAHGEVKPTRGLGSSRGHAPCQEGSRSSSLYPAGGSIDASSPGANAPLVARCAWGSCATCLTETVPCPRTRFTRLSKQNAWRIELGKSSGERHHLHAIPCCS